MIKFIKLINKNEYEQEYNYFNIYFNINNKNQGYVYDLTEYLYGIYYRGAGIDYHISTIYTSNIFYTTNSSVLYPSANLQINNFDTMNINLHNELNPTYEYDNCKILLQRLFAILKYIDDNIIIYYIKSNGITQDGKNYVKSDFINIGNDITKIKFEYPVKYSTLGSDSNMHCGINIIFRTKIIDMNLIYYLIFNDVNLIQVSNNMVHYTLKNLTNSDRFANLTITPIVPQYKTNKYELNTGHFTIMNLSVADFVKKNIKLIRVLDNNNNNDLLKIQNENKELKKQLNKKDESEKQLKKEMEELKNKLANLMKEKELLIDNDEEINKHPKSPIIDDDHKKDKNSKKKKSKENENKNENEDLEIMLSIDDDDN